MQKDMSAARARVCLCYAVLFIFMPLPFPDAMPLFCFSSAFSLQTIFAASCRRFMPCRALLPRRACFVFRFDAAVALLRRFFAMLLFLLHILLFITMPVAV